MILSKTSGYVRTFKVKDGDKDKNNKIISFGIDDAKPLEKHITICTEIEDLKISEFNDLPVYDDRDLNPK